MEEINTKIKMKDKEYTIFVGSSILGKLADFVKQNHANKKVAIIIGEHPSKLHGSRLKAELKELNPLFIEVPSGESSKSREMKENIEDKLLDNKFGRDSLIMAVGGGVIGDLAGFIASTFNRGIPIIHVPTTMLAMVDSSIGGKTGINTKHGKNLIGTTYQPAAVFADMDFLQTLPDEEFRNGLAEVIKMAIIRDKALFDELERNHKKILSRDRNSLQQIIKKNIELKKEVVEQDPFELNLRQILNFGHTFGHALEAQSNYTIKHGFAVAQGMIVETRISVISNNLSRDEEKRILDVLSSFGFPTKINKNLETSRILDLMKSDKKSRGSKPRFVLIDEIGRFKSKDGNFSFEADAKIIEKAIEECKK